MYLDTLLDETARYQKATAGSQKRKPNFLIRKEM